MALTPKDLAEIDAAVDQLKPTLEALWPTGCTDSDALALVLFGMQIMVLAGMPPNELAERLMMLHRVSYVGHRPLIVDPSGRPS